MQTTLKPSGFPENLPPEQIFENKLKQIFTQVCESYGYLPLETSAIEYLEVLSSKGDINKEIYIIKRAQEDGDLLEKKPRALRFDLTVPLARYIAQNYSELIFPFKRYQIQKVWRGERSQKGRFREFYQADIDVVTHTELPLHMDAEVILIMAAILNQFPIQRKFIMHINNRKFLSGFLRSNGIMEVDQAMRIIDKIDKIGQEGATDKLVEELGIEKENVIRLLSEIDTNIPIQDFETWLKMRNLNDENVETNEGLSELRTIFQLISKANFERVSFVFSPKIARGLDYYTGTVCETTVENLENYGSICSGGRYTNLVDKFINKKLPGMGMSIGLTRLLQIIKDEALVDFSILSTAQVLIGCTQEEKRIEINEIAMKCREAGINTDTVPNASAVFDKQFALSKKKNISFLFVESDNSVSLYLPNEMKRTFTSSLDAIQYLSKVYVKTN